MTPAEAIASLDRMLAGHERTITLRRGPEGTPIATATVKAFVKGYKPEELSAGIAQSDSHVIVSPTDLTSWPAGGMKRGDWAIIDGRTRSVEAAENKKLNDVLVRVDMQVRG